MTSELPNGMLTALFDGKATPLEKKQIRDWLREPANHELFFAALEAYETEHPQVQTPVEAGFQHFITQPDGPVAPPRSLLKRTWFSGNFWLAAASMGLVLLLGFWQRDRLLIQRYETGFGQTRACTLPDGSQVTLNANSILLVPRFGFGSQTREVRLTGEAEFDVVHTQTDQQFIVKTPRAVDVVVFGTAFSVLARHQATRIVLDRGQVQVRYQPEHQMARRVTMRPGDLITLDANGELALRHSVEPQRFSAWKDHRFVFDKTSLTEVAGLLADEFGVRVVIPDSAIARRSITGSFKAQTADDLLNSIAEALDLRILPHGDSRTITD